MIGFDIFIYLLRSRNLNEPKHNYIKTNKMRIPPKRADFNLFFSFISSLLTSQQVLATYGQIKSDTNVLLYRLSRTCTRSFAATDLTKSFSCMLMSKAQNQTAPLELQQLSTLETLVVKLDVNYGPNMDASFNASSTNANKTIMVSSAQIVTFTCPFSGNPAPSYYWSVPAVSSNDSAASKYGAKQKQATSTGFYLSTQVYTVPSKYTGSVGSYVFECKAVVGGLVNQESDVIQFTLNVLRE